MKKIVFKMHGHKYNVENYNYTIGKNIDTTKGFADNINISLGIMGKSNIDSLIMEGPSDCSITVYNDAKMVVNELVFNGEITSYTFSESEQSGYASIYLHVHSVKYGEINLKTKISE